MSLTPENLRALLFQSALSDLAPTPRAALVKDIDLRERFAVGASLLMSLPPGLAVTRDSVFAAVKVALDGATRASIRKADGSDLEVELERRPTGDVALRINDQTFLYERAPLLSSDAGERRHALVAMFAETPLSAAEETRWLAVAEAAPLTDQELGAVSASVDATPEAFAKFFSERPDVDVSRLNPKDARYFDRLVAPRDQNLSFADYVAGPLAQCRRVEFSRHPDRSFRRIAFSALSPALVPFELLEALHEGELAVLLDAMDPFSLICGFELAARRATEPEWAALGDGFLHRLFVDRDAAGKRSGVFAGLATFALCRAKRAARALDAPTYWTRLIALAHAGVLADALGEVSDAPRFYAWARENFGVDHHWSATLDRREAPLWSPDLIEPVKIEAYLARRAVTALEALSEDKKPESWAQIVTAEIARIDAADIGAHLFAGPFDDFMPPRPPWIMEEWEKTPGAAQSIDELPALAFCAKLGPASDATVTRLTTLVTDDRDLASEPVDELYALRAAADVAAAARSTTLSEAVVERCFARLRNWGGGQYTGDLISIALTACAATSDRDAYRRRAGELFTRFAWAVDDRLGVGQLQNVIVFAALADPRLSTVLARPRAIVHFKLRRLT